MSTTRRQFFATLFATAVTPALVRLGWKKAIPERIPPGISMRVIRQFDTSLESYVSRIDVLYGWGDPIVDRIGDIITVRLPQRFLCRDGGSLRVAISQ
jgi:hypothetical protein